MYSGVVVVVCMCAHVLYFDATLYDSVFPPLQPSPHRLSLPLLPQDWGLPSPGWVSREIIVGCVSVHSLALVVLLVAIPVCK